MQLEEKTKTGSKEYCCSNPNCKCVFSQPKILMYYVCPSCQSLVDVEGIVSQPVISDPLTEEKLVLLENYNSILLHKSEEVEGLKIKVEGQFEEIKLLRLENANLIKKFEDVEGSLGAAKGEVESVSGKLGEKNKELVEVTEKNLALSRRVESLEVEIESYESRMREDAGRIIGLEKGLLDQEKHNTHLDQSLVDFKIEIKKLKKQREKTIIDTNEEINKRVKAERMANQATEERDKIQSELVDLKEKMIDSIRRETETSEKMMALELELKTRKEAKQLEKIKIPKSKDIEFSNSVGKVQNFELKKNKIKKQDKSLEVDDLNSAKFSYPKQVKSNKSEEASKSSNVCGFYFGYLSERDKGEKIPNACVECSKSLDCMLTKVRQSNKSVKEIKKWYHFK